MYHQQQNKWYPQGFLLAHFGANLYIGSNNLIAHQKHNKLLCESKFAKAKSSVASEMGKVNSLGGGGGVGGTIYFAVDGTYCLIKGVLAPIVARRV